MPQLPALDKLLPLAPWLCLALLLPLTQLLAAWSKRQVVRALGWWGVPLTTGWLGVPVHEASHLLAAKLLGREVVRVRWFAPDADSGSLGGVEWRPGQGPLAWLAILTVGVAPLAGGTLALRGLLLGAALATDLPVPAMPQGADGAAWQAAGLALLHWAQAATAALWSRQDPLAWSAVLGWWAVVSVAAHLTPSRPDLQGAWRGALLVAALVAVAVAGLQAAQIPWQDPVMHAVRATTWWLAPGLLLALPATVTVGLTATLLARLRGQ